MMQHILAYFIGIVLLAGLSGCVTFNDSSVMAQQKEDLLVLREDVNRIQGRVESLELEYRRLRSDIEKLRSTVSDTREQAAVQERLDNLERQLQALDAVREKDRQAIVDQLSSKMAEIMSKGSGHSGKSSSASVPLRGTAADKSAVPSLPARPSYARHSPPPRRDEGGSATTEAGATGYEHIVKEGETLSAIAAAYKVKPSVLIEANDLKNPDALRKGQKLFIPPSP